MVRQTDIVISGAGAAGLTLALLLANVGLNVVIVDPYPPKALSETKRSARTVALMNSSLNIIKQTGVWDTLKDHSAALEQMRILDDSDPLREPIDVPFPASDIGQEQFCFNIPNSFLRAALFDLLQTHDNITFIESAFADYEIMDAHIQVTFENGERYAGGLLVGADGRNSLVREAAGIKASTKTYEQSAITCIINHSRAHQNISTEFHRENGPMALVPLPGNQSSVVWVDHPENVQALLHLKKGEFVQALQDKTHDILGGITLETGPESWPLSTIKTQEITATRIALIAEAAHVMSPITAQGLNLSLRDVATLAEEITDHVRLGGDIGAQNTLRAYERRRSLDINTRVFGVDKMNKTVSTKILGLKRLRRTGLKLMNTPLPIKTLAMQLGLAPQLDEGRLAKGEAL